MFFHARVIRLPLSPATIVTVFLATSELGAFISSTLGSSGNRKKLVSAVCSIAGVLPVFLRKRTTIISLPSFISAFISQWSTDNQGLCSSQAHEAFASIVLSPWPTV